MENARTNVHGSSGELVFLSSMCLGRQIADIETYWAADLVPLEQLLIPIVSYNNMVNQILSNFGYSDPYDNSWK